RAHMEMLSAGDQSRAKIDQSDVATVRSSGARRGWATPSPLPPPSRPIPVSLPMIEPSRHHFDRSSPGIDHPHSASPCVLGLCAHCRLVAPLHLATSPTRSQCSPLTGLTRLG